MYDAIMSENEELLNDSASLQTLCIESILKEEIKRIIHGDEEPSQVTTRQEEQLRNKLLSNCCDLRNKRLRNEHYLRNSFYFDTIRSKNELKYFLEKESINMKT